MSKTGMDGRREPPRTAVIILTLLPSAALALGYIWIATPLPRWLAGLPWRAMLHAALAALPPLAVGALCVPALLFMHAAYDALARWRLDAGEAFRAWLAGTAGAALHAVFLLLAVGSIARCQWFEVGVETLVLAALLLHAWAVRGLLDECDCEPYWQRRLLFPRHEHLRERLARSMSDMGDRRKDANQVFWFNCGGVRLPCPLDAYPGWLERSKTDLTAYVAYHPTLKEDLEASEKRIRRSHGTD